MRVDGGDDIVARDGFLVEFPISADERPDHGFPFTLRPETIHAPAAQFFNKLFFSDSVSLSVFAFLTLPCYLCQLGTQRVMIEDVVCFNLPPVEIMDKYIPLKH